MYPLNDKDLDRLSREAADQYDVESSATGWDQVESRLNEAMPVTGEKEKRRFLFWLFFIALMAGGGLLWMMNGGQKAFQPGSPVVASASVSSNDNTNTKANSTKNSNTTTDKASTTPSSKPGEKASGIADASTHTEGNQPANKIAAAAGPLSNPQIITRRNSNVVTIISGKLPVHKNAIAGGIKDKDLVTGKQPSGKEPAKDPDGNRGNVTKEPTQKDQTIPRDNQDNKIQNDQPGTSTAQPQPDTKEKKNVAPAEEAKKNLTSEIKKAAGKKSLSVKAPLEIGLLAGPDMSYVKFKEGSRMGLNLGLQVGYRFSDRWSVNTGLIYEKKYYTANGGDFSPPKHSWLNYVKLNEVEGNCSMFDIPINVRYDVAYTDKRRFFVSTGLTSYLMHHQAYDYYYNYLGANTKASWDTNSAVNYTFSVLNLSAGFERRIGKEFSVQVEPYVKVPLIGLGFGSMKLDSYGVFFSVKYKPELRKKK